MNALILLLSLLLSMTAAFRVRNLQRNNKCGSTKCFASKGPREMFTEFTVVPCPPQLKEELGVSRWGTWSTRDSSKYLVGKKSPLKVYDCNELSYIISGKMTITPDEGPNKGVAVPGYMY